GVLMEAFFFSSGRRHTSFSRDWSSDVCSSDLARDPQRIVRKLLLRNLSHEIPQYLLRLITRRAIRGARGPQRRPARTARRPVPEIGRASCRERVEIAGGSGLSK